MVKANQEPNGTPEGVLLPRPLISVSDLSEQAVPEQKLANNDEVKALYPHLAALPMYPFVTTFGGKTEFFVVCPPLRGKQLQQVFHFAAPSKSYGPDYNDTQNDWKNLYKPDNAPLLRRHQQLANWGKFEPHRLFLLSFIQNDRDEKATEQDLVVPVVHITRENGQLRWGLDNLDEERRRSLERQTPYPRSETVVYLPVLGPTFVGAYCPDETSSWGSPLNLDLQKGGTTMTMGATQALAITLTKSEELLNTPLLQRLLAFVETGELPLPPLPQSGIVADLGVEETTTPKIPEHNFIKKLKGLG